MCVYEFGCLSQKRVVDSLELEIQVFETLYRYLKSSMGPL